MRRPGGPLLLVCAALIVAGCGGGETGSSSVERDLPEASPTASASLLFPIAELPPAPAAAAELTADGAEEFASHWFELAEYAYATGNTEPMMDVSLPECTACTSIKADIDDVYESGGRFEGVTLQADGAVAPPVEQRGTVVSLLLHESAFKEIAVDGSEKIDPPAERQPVDVFLRAVDGAWRVFDVGAGAS